ncbi:MAG: 50S ribosomal protein L19e [Candidatus Geothermarchaeales archaeon]
MVNIRLKKRLAARVLDVGADRVWFDPENLDELEGIDTREDVKALVNRGVIRVLPRRGQSKKEKRVRRGAGSRKGKKTARVSKKERWMIKVRAQRRLLRQLRERGTLSPTQYRQCYRMVKGGVFRSKTHLLDHIKAQMLKSSGLAR